MVLPVSYKLAIRLQHICSDGNRRTKSESKTIWNEQDYMEFPFHIVLPSDHDAFSQTKTDTLSRRARHFSTGKYLRWKLSPTRFVM